MKTKRIIDADFGTPNLNPRHFPPEGLFDCPIGSLNLATGCRNDVHSWDAERLEGRFIYMAAHARFAAVNRRVSLVFQHEPRGWVYITGYCHAREANRTFCLDVIMVVHVRN